MPKVFCWKNRRTWPVDWPGCEIEPDSEAAWRLASRLEQEYSSFVAYHACRPLDVASYYRDGVGIASHSDLLQLALCIFADGTFSEISPEDVLAAAQDMPSTSDARLYVALDDRHIINWCGHYLLYGSEYVTGIAAGLMRRYGRDYRQYLKSFGRPTVFELQIPLDWMSGDCLAELASVMSRAVFHNNVACEEDFTVTLHRHVPPEFIRLHSHPKVIRDPLSR